MKTRLDGFAAVVVVAVAGQRHQANGRQVLLLAQAAGNFVSIHARHGDVQKHHIGAMRHDVFDRLASIVRNRHLLTDSFKHHGQGLGRSVDVVDDQDAMPRQAVAAPPSRSDWLAVPSEGRSPGVES